MKYMVQYSLHSDGSMGKRQFFMVITDALNFIETNKYEHHNVRIFKLEEL